MADFFQRFFYTCKTSASAFVSLQNMIMKSQKEFHFIYEDHSRYTKISKIRIHKLASFLVQITSYLYAREWIITQILRRYRKRIASFFTAIQHIFTKINKNKKWMCRLNQKLFSIELLFSYYIYSIHLELCLCQINRNWMRIKLW